MDKMSLDMRNGVVVGNRVNSMVDNRHSMVGMVEHGTHGFVNDGCSVCRSWHNGWSVCRRRCTVGRLRHVVGSLRRVFGLAFIGHLSYEPFVVVGGVVHVLDPSIGQGNRVGALP